MEIVLKTSGFTIKTLGKQEIKDIEYRPINLLIINKEDNGYLVYNTLIREIIFLTNQEYTALVKGKVNLTETSKYLIENWYLVPLDFNENQCFDQLKVLYNLYDNNNNYINYFVVLTTTECNARCFYCFEKNQPRYTMEKKTAQDVAKFIIENRDPTKKVEIKWFGGEPLCNTEAMDIISNILEENNIDFYSRITTNGKLFNKEYIEKASGLWRVCSVQITLDGAEETYNKIKAYVDVEEGTSPFQIVMDNIENLTKQNIYVHIRLNLDKYNRDDMYALVNYINERFSGNMFVKIYAKLLFDDTSIMHMNRTNQERGYMFDELKRLEEYIEKLGFTTYSKISSAPKFTLCIADYKHATIVMPRGELGLCDQHTDSDFYGNIYDGITDRKAMADFTVKQRQIPECKTCCFYAICVRLAKCPYYLKKCEPYEKEIFVNQVKRNMHYTYIKYMEEKAE